MESPRESRPLGIGRTALICALIVGVYYLVPIHPGADEDQLIARVVGTLVGGLLATWLIIRQVSRQLTDPEHAPLTNLLAALVGGVAFFALVDYGIAVMQSGQFVGLHTKTDALYFALTTLTTVGYGDIHAAGQLARGVVMAQLVFNVVVITTAASVLSRQIGARARERRAPKPPQSPSLR
jgi:voltage-gated potassium channel